MTISKDEFVVSTQERREEEPAHHGWQIDAMFLVE